VDDDDDDNDVDDDYDDVDDDDDDDVDDDDVDDDIDYDNDVDDDDDDAVVDLGVVRQRSASAWSSPAETGATSSVCLSQLLRVVALLSESRIKSMSCRHAAASSLLSCSPARK